jgi:GR25 family glycosyltransferase involved in LPS biosynthesis
MKHINYLDGIDIIYWINLNRALDRRMNMEKLFKDPVFDGIKNVRIHAFDAKYKNPRKKFTIEQDYDLNNLNRRRTNNEYAILCSHLNTIHQFSTTNYENALIFEDDLSLEYKSYWKKSIREIIENAPSDWEIIKLSSGAGKIYNHLYNAWEPFMIHVPKHIDKWNTKILYGDWLAHGYIIKNKAAKKLMKEIYHDGKYELNNKMLHVADGFIFQKLKTYVYKYPYFTYQDKNISYNIKKSTSLTIHTKKIITNMYKKTRKL